MKIIKRYNNTIAVIKSDTVIIRDGIEAIEVVHTCNCDKIILPENAFPDSFFDLRTGLAGEILQRFINYHYTVAIIGDFSKYKSNSLNQFIRECNNGEHIFFLPDEETALQRMKMPNLRQL